MDEQRAATPLLSVQARQGGVELVEQIADEWRGLCEASPCDEPFFRPEWIAAYVRFFVPAGKLLLVTVRSGDRLTGVLPLVEERAILSGFPVRRLRGATVQAIWRYDLALAPGALGDATVEAIWRFLRELPGWDVLEFPDVPEGGNIERLMAIAKADAFPTETTESMRTPYVSLTGWGGSEEYWLRNASSSFRSNVRRAKRKIKERGPLELRRYEHAEPALLERFYKLEASGWKGRAGSAIASRELVRRYHDELARVAERYGYFTLFFLELNGRAIAADFGLTYRGRFYGPKAGYDEAFHAFSPGHLLVEAELCDCAARGLERYDFLGRGEEWKRKWTAEFRRHSYQFVFRKDWYGRLARFSKARVNPLLKRVLGRRDPLQI